MTHHLFQVFRTREKQEKKEKCKKKKAEGSLHRTLRLRKVSQNQYVCVFALKNRSRYRLVNVEFDAQHACIGRNNMTKAFIKFLKYNLLIMDDLPA